jgi:hypothetical protein
MNKSITVTALDKVKTVINTEHITHMIIQPDNKIVIFMAGGATISFDDGPAFLFHLRKMYPEMVTS